MRAIVIRSHGGPEVLQIEELAPPRPRPGEVLVEVRACGLNHLDVWVRRGVPGYSFPLPLIPGNDAVGRVVEAPGSDDLTPGTTVVVAPATSCGHCRMCLSGRDHRCRDYKILG